MIHIQAVLGISDSRMPKLAMKAMVVMKAMKVAPMKSMKKGGGRIRMGVKKTVEKKPAGKVSWG